VGNGKVKAPVIVAPGHPDNSSLSISATDASLPACWFGRGLQRLSDSIDLGAVLRDGSLKKVDGKWGVAITKSHYQDHRSARVSGQGHGNNSLEADEAISERGIIRYATLDEYKANPNFAHEGEGHDTPEMGTSIFPTGRTRKTSGACRST